MLPIDFPQRNLVLGKPEGMTDEDCGNLPVWKGEALITEQNIIHASIISCWQLSKEDLEEIQRTGRIWLTVIGNAMPPVDLFTEDPFEAAKKYNEQL